jgi:3-oxoacyl-[acyl-carrier protein] reductase
VKVAVITGGSSGIGAALARQLTDRGVRCVLVARGLDRLERVAVELDAEPEACDVADRAAVDALAQRVRERHPAIHLLVNNAGIPGRRGFLQLEPERIEEVVRVNYLGGVWCLRAFLPLLEAGRPSHVVNVASVAGTVAGGPSGPYTAAKFAQVAFSRTVAGELASRGVSVHTVNPGFTHTEGFPQDSFLAHPVWRHTVVSPERVAAAILDSVERDRPEVFVPGYYRAATLLQAFAPATLARLAARRGPGTEDRR